MPYNITRRAAEAHLEDGQGDGLIAALTVGHSAHTAMLRPTSRPRQPQGAALPTAAAELEPACHNPMSEGSKFLSSVMRLKVRHPPAQHSPLLQPLPTQRASARTLEGKMRSAGARSPCKAQGACYYSHTVLVLRGGWASSQAGHLTLTNREREVISSLLGLEPDFGTPGAHLHTATKRCHGCGPDTCSIAQLLTCLLIPSCRKDHLVAVTPT